MLNEEPSSPLEIDPEANVVNFPGLTDEPLTPDHVLRGSKGQYRKFVLVGEDLDGTVCVAVAGISTYPAANWMLDQGKQFLLRNAEADEE